MMDLRSITITVYVSMAEDCENGFSIMKKTEVINISNKYIRANIYRPPAVVQCRRCSGRCCCIIWNERPHDHSKWYDLNYIDSPQRVPHQPHQQLIISYKKRLFLSFIRFLRTAWLYWIERIKPEWFWTRLIRYGFDVEVKYLQNSGILSSCGLLLLLYFWWLTKLLVTIFGRDRRKK